MCDLLCALGPATADGVTRFAKNSDRPPNEPQVVEWHPPRREGSTRATYIEIPAVVETLGFLGSRPVWMWGVEHGVNEAGVAAGNATIYTTLDPRGFPDALTGMDLVRLALERASTASAAVEVVTDLILAHGQGGSGHEGSQRPYWSSFLVADPVAAFVIETSGRTVAIEEVVRTRAISNRTTIPAFDAEHRHPRQPVETLVDPRWRASQAVLAAEPVTTEALEAHLASHVGGTDGWTVCMHVEGVEATTAAMVAELPADSPPRARFATGSPCANPFLRRNWSPE
jgi:secernin